MHRPIVGLLEDDPRVRNRIAAVLDRMSAWQLAFSVGSVAEAMTALNERVPDYLLVDLGLPDGSGLDIIRYAVGRYRHCQVLVISVFGDDDKIFRSIEAGAAGYLLKGVTDDELLVHLQNLQAGGSPMSPKIARRVLNQFRGRLLQPDPADDQEIAQELQAIALTNKEQEILTSLTLGHSYGEVADTLGISLNTVRHHIKNIYSKLSVHSRHEAIREAGRLGLITPATR